MSNRIVPAVLTDNTKHLAQMLRQAECFANWVQIDIMDGLFVPSRSVSASDIANIETSLAWEAHLMVQEPRKYIDDFCDAGAKRIIVHYEAVKENAEDLVEYIINLGMTAGLALNPETPVGVLNDRLLSKLECVLFMAVHPGFYGAQFLPEVLDKIASFRQNYPNVSIGIDGGVKAANIVDVARSGANEICVGSAIFAQPDLAAAYFELNQLVGFGQKTNVKP